MILEKIVERVKMQIEEDMRLISLEEMKGEANVVFKESGHMDFPFEKALNNKWVNFICEVKKASPSKGILVKDFDPVSIAKEYERAGASCISVLTERDFFLGSPQYLVEIKRQVNIPLLRKDFTIHPYQIYESKVLGADCILLIASILDDEELRNYLELSHKLGLSVLVECRDEKEIKMAIKAGARIIGVNNRNLSSFKVDVNHSIKLRDLVPKEIIFVSESGIKTDLDVKKCKDAKVNAVLIGETLMKSEDKKLMIDELRSLV